MSIFMFVRVCTKARADPEGGAHPARTPPKFGNKYDFLA